MSKWTGINSKPVLTIEEQKEKALQDAQKGNTPPAVAPEPKKKKKKSYDTEDYKDTDAYKQNKKLLIGKYKPRQLNITNRKDQKGSKPGAQGIEKQKKANNKYIAKHYSGDSDLPKRPKAPKMPKLKLPGGIERKKVKNPSGLKGKIFDYKASGDYNYDDQGYNPKNTMGGIKDMRKDYKADYKAAKKSLNNNLK